MNGGLDAFGPVAKDGLPPPPPTADNCGVNPSSLRVPASITERVGSDGLTAGEASMSVYVEAGAPWSTPVPIRRSTCRRSPGVPGRRTGASALRRLAVAATSRESRGKRLEEFLVALVSLDPDAIARITPLQCAT
jgi:hypothetical protein